MTGDNGKDRAIVWIGVLVLVGFGVLLVYMFGLLSSSETTWNRALYLFSGVEAIAFAAAGYFFGREVHRTRAEQAEARAYQAEQQWQQWSQRALEAETKGQSLSTVADMLAKQHPELEPLAQMAQTLFPSKP
jgi:hypothetical protein